MSRAATAVVVESPDDTVTPTPEVVVQAEPVTVAPVTKTARVKGTWTQYYGGTAWNFEDRKSYDLPLALYEYLKTRDCIYDTI